MVLPNGGQASPGLSDVTPTEAVAALTRVLNSPAFRRSRRSTEFLSYVGSEVLAGRGEAIYERAVAERALGLKDDFDGRVDTSVRVQATRVRKALRDYYAGPGASDEVRVLMPTGGYAAVFSRVGPDAVAAPALPLDASVGVVSFDPPDAANAELSMILAHALTRRLSDCPGLRVVGPSRRVEADPLTVARQLGVRFLLRTSMLTADPDVLATLQLVNAEDGCVLWSDDRRLDPGAGTTLAVIDVWAVAAAAQLGDYAGLVLRLTGHDELPRSARDSVGRAAFYRHVVQGTRESMEVARDALDDAINSGAESADLHAMRAFIIANLTLTAADKDSAPDKTAASLSSVEADARLALQQTPRSALAHLALGVAAMIRRQWELSRSHAKAAADLDPGHPYHLFSAGGILATSGDWKAGTDLTRRSFALNPDHPPYQHTNLAVERLLDGDLAGALAEASIVDEAGLAWGSLCRALALRGLGHVEEAEAEMAATLRLVPQLLDDTEAVFSDILLTDAQRRTLDSLLVPFRKDEQPQP